MRRITLLGVLIAVGATGIAARKAGQPQPDTAEIEKVKENLFMIKNGIKNGGGNTAVFITSKGVVLVDTKNPGWGQRIMDKVRSVTDKPVTTIIKPTRTAITTAATSSSPPRSKSWRTRTRRPTWRRCPRSRGRRRSSCPTRRTRTS